MEQVNPSRLPTVQSKITATMEKGMKKFEVIRISGIAMGVGFVEKLPDGSGSYSETICETLYDTGNDKKDAAESEKWATIICNALNKNIKTS